MILQKDLTAESGLKEDAARRVLRRLKAAEEITPVKDHFNHNRISYSEEDADKIRQALLQKEEETVAAAKAGPGEGEGKTVEPGSPPGAPATEEPPPASGAKSAKELAAAEGSKKRKKPAPPKADEKEEPERTLKELLGDNQQTLLLIAGGVALLLFVLWLRRRSTAGGPAQPASPQATAQGAKPAREMTDDELRELRAKWEKNFRES